MAKIDKDYLKQWTKLESDMKVTWMLVKNLKF